MKLNQYYACVLYANDLGFRTQNFWLQLSYWLQWRVSV